MKNYNPFLQKALHGIVKDILSEVAKNGLSDDSYYVISFKTPTATIPDFVRAKYPEEMTIILQHQFFNLYADEKEIGVTLTFGGVPSDIKIPYTNLISFMDPSQKFGLTFTPEEMVEETPKTEEHTAEIIDLASHRKKQ